MTRNIHVLERFGVIQVTEKPLPGHTERFLLLMLPVAASPAL